MATCLNCGVVLTDLKRTKYCSWECNKLYIYKGNKKKEELIKKELLEEMRSRIWRRNTLSKLNRFYEIFGQDHNCDICGCSTDEAISKYGVHLHIFLKPNINDYRVMDLSSWNRYCSKCYSNIFLMKLENEDNSKTEHNTNVTQV